MKIIIRMIFVVTGLIASVCAQSADTTSKRTHDGRRGTGCSGANGFCSLSFYQLMASVDYYNNKNISLRGYLVLDDKVLSLYPSEYLYQLGDKSSSVTFYVPASEQYAVAKKYAYSNVQIIGHFNSNEEGMDYLRLGVMDKIITVSPIVLRDAIGKREEPSVRLEDLDEAVKH